MFVFSVIERKSTGKYTRRRPAPLDINPVTQPQITDQRVPTLPSHENHTHQGNCTNVVTQLGRMKPDLESCC